jgi:hypothetical protein
MKIVAVKTTILVLILSVLSLSSVYSSENQISTNSSKNKQLRDELKGVDGKKAMEIANEWRLKKIDIVTFVTPDTVNFKFKDGETISIPVPDDVMIVSIAPYVNKTHKCATHYMSSCDAELKNEDMKITAFAAGGKILINKTMKTGPTGFLDLWLPRNQEIDIAVSAKGKKATGKIYTYRNSKTCDTTLKLE